MAAMSERWIREVQARVAPLGLRPEREAEIVDELVQHVDEHVRELISGGASLDAAIAQAIAGLDAPGVLTSRLAALEPPPRFLLPPPGTPARGSWLMARIFDVAHAVRGLRRAPAFAAMVIATMALTIGPTTAVVSIGNWLLWRPVPAVSNADRLAVAFFGRWQPDGRGVGPHRVSPLNIADFRDGSELIEAIAGTQEGSEAVSINGQPATQVQTAHADAALFPTLGLRPAAGRFFAPEEDVLPFGTTVAVVSHGLALRAFGSAENAIAKKLTLNGHELTIVGVAPDRFRGITPFSIVDVWYPGAAYRRLHNFSSIPQEVTRRDGTFYSFVVRLAPSATFAAVQAELEQRGARLAELYPDAAGQFREVRARVFPGLGPQPLAREEYATLVQRLLLMAGLLIALGSANVANLLMFRTVQREREYAVRVALGAGRARLLQLQLIESCLLAVAGAALGVVLASAMTRLIVNLVLPAAFLAGVEFEVPIDGRVLATTLAIAVACGLAATLLPAWIGLRRPAVAGLNNGARSTPRGRRLRAAFASVQLALSVALLVGALLMVTTVRGLTHGDTGYDADGVSVHGINLDSHGYRAPQALQYVRELDAALSALPGISVAAGSSFPLGSSFREQVRVPGGSGSIDVNSTAVGARYFDVLRIPILKGRVFTADEAFAPAGTIGNPAIISRSIARQLFGETEPLGRQIQIGGRQPETLAVVGVVGDVPTDLLTREPALNLYLPFGGSMGPFATRPILLVRSSVGPRAAGDTVAALAARIDPRVPVSLTSSLAAMTIDRQLSSQRIFAWVLSLLGGFGFVLAAVGLYGLLAQAVTERTREIGVRQALGATRAQIYSLVLRQATAIAAVGAILGFALALGGVRVIESQLWGVAPRDPFTYAIAALALVAIVFAAAAWPARCATKVDPIQALRVD